MSYDLVDKSMTAWLFSGVTFAIASIFPKDFWFLIWNFSSLIVIMIIFLDVFILSKKKVVKK